MIRLFKVFMAPGAEQIVGETLRSGYIGQGPQVEAFEQQFGQLVEASETPLALNSCTSALDLALHLIGVGPGDEVITTPMTCTATNGVIVTRRARPIWADIDPCSGLIDPADVDRKITRRTRAIIAVDWGGRSCDYEMLEQFGIPVVEDAAHALLTRYQGRSIAQVGGDYICWSFQAIKHLTTGDGGALLPPHAQIERGRLLRWYGLDRRSGESFRCQQNIQEVGYKYHMNDIAAGIGLANLPHTRYVVDQHRQHANVYHQSFSQLQRVVPPMFDLDTSWWLYTLLTDDRDSFIQFLGERGIEASPVHNRTDRHTGFHYPNGSLPGTDAFASREVAIPVGWWLTPDEQSQIIDAVWAWDRR